MRISDWSSDVCSSDLIRRLLLHDLGGLGLEVTPKGFKDLLPGSTPAADLIQFVFKSGSEIIGDIAFEKTLKKGGYQPTALLCKKAILFDPDIIAVLQCLMRRCISRWSSRSAARRGGKEWVSTCSSR